MTLLMEYWWLAIAILAIIIIAFMFLTIYIKLPNSKKAKKVKEWLLFAVVQAEKELGSGTGQLKLRYVYNLALSKFPICIKLIPFELFSSFVDGALQQLKNIIEDNEGVKEYMEKILGKEDEK